MTNETTLFDGISRRSVMKASAVGAGALATSATANRTGRHRRRGWC
ncbi:twin-arginine translocation signal domain-containing protein [Natronoglomus mannanivorans]